SVVSPGLRFSARTRIGAELRDAEDKSGISHHRPADGSGKIPELRLVPLESRRELHGESRSFERNQSGDQAIQQPPARTAAKLPPRDPVIHRPANNEPEQNAQGNELYKPERLMVRVHRRLAGEDGKFQRNGENKGGQVNGSRDYAGPGPSARHGDKRAPRCKDRARARHMKEEGGKGYKKQGGHRHHVPEFDWRQSFPETLHHEADLFSSGSGLVPACSQFGNYFLPQQLAVFIQYFNQPGPGGARVGNGRWNIRAGKNSHHLPFAFAGLNPEFVLLPLGH